MDVVIEEITSTIRTVDGDALLHPSTLAKLIQAAVAAMEDKLERDKRRKADARVDDDDGREGRDGDAM
jgi:hypothetical protein